MEIEKVCVITGASGGIGQEIAKKFYNHGYHVVLLDLVGEKIQDMIKKYKFKKNKTSCYSVDISDEKQVKETVELILHDVKRIDVLVNTAGICGDYMKTIEYAFDNFKKIYDVNVYGTFLMMQHILPIMVKQKGGSIVNFGSVSGMRGYSYEIGYGSSKWAVIGMTKTVANEYGEYGIRTNSVSPGWVHTEMMKKTLDSYRALGDEEIGIGPMKRPAMPAEVASAVYYLSSEEAGYINGTNLLVDGGKLCD